ncbi:MAG: hypothetical protein JWO33_2790 [Caulobacteraceae bacterium]|nr:hypothetical protein [Caulobacteraceae bacterium]
MDMEDQIREAVVGELTRQAEASDGAFKAMCGAPGRLKVEGEIDLDALSMAVVGSVAGGP